MNNYFVALIHIDKPSSVLGRTRLKTQSSASKSSEEDIAIDKFTDLKSDEMKKDKSNIYKGSIQSFSMEQSKSKENLRTSSITEKLSKINPNTKRPYLFWKPEKKKKKVQYSNQTNSKLNESISNSIRDDIKTRKPSKIIRPAIKYLSNAVTNTFIQF